MGVTHDAGGPATGSGAFGPAPHTSADPGSDQHTHPGPGPDRATHARAGPGPTGTADADPAAGAALSHADGTVAHRDNAVVGPQAERHNAGAAQSALSDYRAHRDVSVAAAERNTCAQRVSRRHFPTAERNSHAQRGAGVHFATAEWNTLAERVSRGHAPLGDHPHAQP